ncbi:esterase/lipase family protein [Anabaena azotica]|uniref:esterase/lipase family protein n=1 Tax=Anabaena azotica TaxID=197653 RepID=UPI001F54A5BE|nr:alpha/beta hydrolase [Anabaena azotica]
MQGQWTRKAKNGLNIIFIHGINSSKDCWRHENGSYWPNLLRDESELADIGIYVFSYRTGINTGFYSLSDIVDSLREYFLLDDLISSTGVIFVCHSMGGIVTRRFLVNQHSMLVERGLTKIGLFLVASPSLGSDYANMLGLLSSVMGHTQASALRFSQSNVWLNDLDKDFINLRTNKDLQIRGKELIEDLPLYGKGLIKKQIVEPFSGAKYFGNSFKVPGSDHSTIATPANSDAVQHRLLVQFIKDFLQEEVLTPKPDGSLKGQTEKPEQRISKKTSTFNLQGAQFGGGLVNADTVNAGQIGGNITNYNPEQKQNLAQAAAEIQQLLNQLSQIYPTTTTSQKMTVVARAMDEIESNPTLKAEVIGALKSGRTKAFKELIDHPLVNVFMAAVEGWQDTGEF